MEYFAVFAYEFFPLGKRKKEPSIHERKTFEFNSLNDRKAHEEAINQLQTLERNPKIGNVNLELLAQGRIIVQ